MKLSVSTLGCPEWSFKEILTRCKEYGYDAIELRGIGKELDVTKTEHFANSAAIAKTKQQIADAGLAVSAIDTSVRLADTAHMAEHMAEGRAAIDLATELGASYIRVFGGEIPAGEDYSTAIDHVMERLVTLGDYAAEAGPVIVTLETHDAFCNGPKLAEAFGHTDHKSVGILWDIYNSTAIGDDPLQAIPFLAPYVRFLHVKDGKIGGKYGPLGEGDIPVRECLAQLAAKGYDDYVSVEWEKRWHPDIDEPEVAFPQYATMLRRYLSATN